jgi:hypothetical protein
VVDTRKIAIVVNGGERPNATINVLAPALFREARAWRHAFDSPPNFTLSNTSCMTNQEME